MTYFTKCVSTYSFRGLNYYGSSFLKKEADQNVVLDGLVSLPCFICAVLPTFAVGGYHLWENVHSSSKQQLTDRDTGTSMGAVLAGDQDLLQRNFPRFLPAVILICMQSLTKY